MEDELKQVVTSLFNALNAKSEEEATEMFGEAINHAKESKVKINDPENFDCFINHKMKKGIELLASTLHEPSICKDKNKPNFIYVNYSFLESHIRNLCELREGSVCCTDKSRHIIEMYLEYAVTGQIPLFNPYVEKYWVPKFGDNEMWIKYCDSLYRLYYGHIKEYLEGYTSLMKCKIRKYKHILHNWYMEFNDGEIIEFGYSWDDEDKSPLEGAADLGEFYLVSKIKVKNRKYEVFFSKNEEEQMICGDFYVKVPKKDIKRVYKESEERFV